MEQTKFTRFKRITIKNLLAILIVLMFMLGSIYICKADTTNKNTNIDTIRHKEIKIQKVSYEQPIINILDTVQIKDNLKNKLIDEVSKYIKKQAPNSYQFIPKYLVQAGLSNNIDICFMMAQTQIETGYGTMGAGRATSRRSMFGVYGKRYLNYEDAINHYCEVLKKHYLTKGRNEQHLLSKYVTSKGGRYASNPRYEIELKTAYNQIKRTTNIYSLQEEYKKF